jgi:CRISPR-associated protein Csa2
MVSLSMSLRIEVNAEAFNAVETVGNLTKHRRAPMIIPTESGYRLIYVPAVSGESIANAYQRNLVEATKIIYQSNPPLTQWDLRYEFSKFMDNSHLTQNLLKIVQSKPKDITSAKHEFEKIAIRESIVADIGGFLYAEEAFPVKRTSRFYSGYMLPTYDSIEATAIEAQFHARHMPAEAGAGGQRAAQMIYYVEIASALYGVTIMLDIDGIGRTSLVKIEDAVDPGERANRVKAALAALQGLFLGVGFGAKLSRFMPVKRVISAVAIVTSPIATIASPAQVPTYIEDTESKILKLASTSESLGINTKYEIIAYGGRPKDNKTKRASTAEEFFEFVIDSVLRSSGIRKSS